MQYVDTDAIKRVSTKQHNKKTNNALRVAGRELSYHFRSRKAFHSFAGRFAVLQKDSDGAVAFTEVKPGCLQSKDPWVKEVLNKVGMNCFAGTVGERILSSFKIADLLLAGREQKAQLTASTKSEFFNRSI